MIRPKGHAALSRSTSVKLPALPVVVDYPCYRFLYCSDC